MDADILTIGFARRATAYKRPALIFRDPESLWLGT
jgi:glucan phosphorylase